MTEGEFFEAVRSIIYKHVSSEVDTHFIDRIHLVGVPDAAAEIAALALSPSPVSEGVMVKALEWTEWGGGCRVSTIIGTYQVKHDGDEPEEWSLRRDNRFFTGCGFFSTEQVAKAAAQADFETRIRSALVASPNPAEPAGERLSAFSTDELCPELEDRARAGDDEAQGASPPSEPYEKALRELRQHVFLGARSSDIRRANDIIDAALKEPKREQC